MHGFTSKTRRLARAVLPAALISLAGLAAVAPAMEAKADPVKVGVVMTFSGGAAQFGEQILRGMELCMAEHAEAFGGHAVELIKRDAQRPGGDIARNAVQELITREGVDMLAGFVFSPNAIASAPLVDQAKVPMIIMNAGTAWITTLSPYIARVSFSMWHTGYPMGRYGAGRWATVLLVEQNTRFALDFAPRALVLDRGRIVHDGPGSDPRDPQVLQRLLGLAVGPDA